MTVLLTSVSYGWVVKCKSKCSGLSGVWLLTGVKPWHGQILNRLLKQLESSIIRINFPLTYRDVGLLFVLHKISCCIGYYIKQHLINTKSRIFIIYIYSLNKHKPALKFICVSPLYKKMPVFTAYVLLCPMANASNIVIGVEKIKTKHKMIVKNMGLRSIPNWKLSGTLSGNCQIWS